MMLYGSWYVGDGYLDFMASHGKLDYDSSRHILFASSVVTATNGQVDRTAIGATGGRQNAVSANTGYDWHWRGLSVGPVVSLSYVSVNIDGFEESGADVVQAGVQLMNVHTNWWSLRNCLEYYFWFRSRLHFHAEKRFIPLGGNTVFTRTELLREVGGWDPNCLAEDCEIGVRLSTRGAVVAVAYDPQAVTREETPGMNRFSA